MKGKEINPWEPNPGSFDFIIRPLSLNVKLLPDGMYHLEFQKGPQHVRILEENIVIESSKEFLFQNGEQIIVKLHNPKSGSVSWSLYRNHEEKFEYIDSVKFNLNDLFSSYAKDLKTYSAEYSNVLAVRGKNEPIGLLWNSLKTKLKNSSIVGEASNEVGCVRLRYSLEIKGELDYISEKEGVKSVKSKLSSRGSLESEIKSSESKKSLLAKKSQEISTVEKTVEREVHQLKMESIIKEDPENLIIQIHEESPSISPQSKQNIPQTIYPSTEQIKTTPFTPFVPLLPGSFQKRTILSDIVENSYEGSSNMHSGEQSDRKNKQLSEMPESSLSSNAFMKRKTYTFEAVKSEEGPLRRINTHQSIKHTSQLEQEEDLEIERQEREAVSLMRKKHTEAESEDNTKESSLKPSHISVSSNQTSRSYQSSEKEIEHKQQSNVKSLLLLLFIFVLFLVSAGGLILPLNKPQKHKIFPDLSKNTAKLQKIDIKTLFTNF